MSASSEEPTLIERLIAASARNKFLIVIFTIFGIAAGIFALQRTPLDAIPDLSDVQVIVYTDWEGRSPDLVEDQITYPISTRFIAAPKVKFVRGESMFGKSFVYVIFEDGTDIYWARSRVIEYLSSVRGMLPEGVNPVIGPDATGVGWVFEYALVDETGKHNLAELRSYQDWSLRYALESVKGVAEVAPVGGFVKQYQVDLDPNKLLAYNIPLSEVVQAIKMSNADVGGKVFEIATTEYFVRGRGYIKDPRDIENIVLKVENGTPVYVRNVGTVHLGPDIRRGVAELDGKGEVVGGIVVMRYGEKRAHGHRRHQKEAQGDRASLPQGVRVVPVYDRSELIHRAIDTLREKLIEESIVVALVCIVFLWHVRSALVAIITLPIAIILSFIPMLQAGPHLEHHVARRHRDRHRRDGRCGHYHGRKRAQVAGALPRRAGARSRWTRARRGYHEGGPECRTPAVLLSAGHHSELHSGFLAGSAGGTALPAPGVYEDLFYVLCRAARRDTRAGAHGLANPRQDYPEIKNPINRFLIWAYQPFVDFVLRFRWLTLGAALLILVATYFRSAGLATSSCRRSTKAPSSICRPPCPACRSTRRRRFSKSRIAC